MTLGVSECSPTQAERPGVLVRGLALGFARRLVRRLALCGHGALRRLRQFHQLRRKRRGTQALARLSDAQLGDIGLSRAQVEEKVGNAWFWG